MIRRRRRATEGATAVEFALIAPVAIAFMMAIVEFSLVLWTQVTLQYGVDEAVNYAMKNTSATSATLQDAAKAYSAGLASNQITVTVANDTVGTVTYVKVTASYTYTYAIPFWPFPDLTLRAMSRGPLIS